MLLRKAVVQNGAPGAELLGPRVHQRRVLEVLVAAALDRVSTFVVCCPKDVTMYEDAVKTSGHEGEIEVRELTELVLEGGRVAGAVEPMPDLLSIVTERP